MECQMQQRPKRQEQRIFGVENPIENPTVVPPDVLKSLRDDSRVKSCLTNGADEFSESWFRASNIQLHGGNARDLIVQSSEPCLAGANIAPFWIFKKTQRGYDLILSTDALGLEILSSTTNGYRDIRGTQATAEKTINVVFRFDGRMYKDVQ